MKLKLLDEYKIGEPVWVTVFPGIQVFCIVQARKNCTESITAPNTGQKKCHKRPALYVCNPINPVYMRITTPENIQPATKAQEKLMHQLHKRDIRLAMENLNNDPQ